jgi:hypothetical protein
MTSHIPFFQPLFMRSELSKCNSYPITTALRSLAAGIRVNPSERQWELLGIGYAYLSHSHLQKKALVLLLQVVWILRIVTIRTANSSMSHEMNHNAVVLISNHLEKNRILPQIVRTLRAISRLSKTAWIPPFRNTEKKLQLFASTCRFTTDWQFICVPIVISEWSPEISSNWMALEAAVMPVELLKVNEHWFFSPREILHKKSNHSAIVQYLHRSVLPEPMSIVYSLT